MRSLHLPRHLAGVDEGRVAQGALPAAEVAAAAVGVEGVAVLKSSRAIGYYHDPRG